MSRYEFKGKQPWRIAVGYDVYLKRFFVAVFDDRIERKNDQLDQIMRENPPGSRAYQVAASQYQEAAAIFSYGLQEGEETDPAKIDQLLHARDYGILPNDIKERLWGDRDNERNSGSRSG